MWYDRKPKGDDDSQLPPELRGKSPEEVAAALKKTSELEATLATQKQQLEEAQGKLGEVDTLKAKLAELEAKATPTPDPAKPNPSDEATSIWTDPAKFIDESTRGTQTVALAAGIMSAKMYAKSLLSATDAKIWGKYEKELDKVMEGYVPAARVNPENWKIALTYVKGQHYEDIMKAQSSGTDFFAETPSGSPPPAPVDDNKLTDEEAKMCDAMHWDRAGYLKRKKDMQIAQADKGAYARFSA